MMQKLRLFFSLFVVIAVVGCSTADRQASDTVIEQPAQQQQDQAMQTDPPFQTPYGYGTGPQGNVDQFGTTPLDQLGGQPGTIAQFTEFVGDTVLFRVDSSELTPQGQALLNRQADWLLRYPQYSITIEGHADERGTREYNLGLGNRRASATSNFLQALGIAPHRIRTISYGKERPIAFEARESAWSKNRRTVTKLKPAVQNFSKVN